MSDTSEVVRVLCRARDSIARATPGTSQWHFSDWDRCAVGHIAGAAGVPVRQHGNITVPKSGLYREALSAVATEQALEMFKKMPDRAPAYAVSYMIRRAVTGAGKANEDDALRQASLMVLNNAIAKLQAPQVEAEARVAARV